MAQKKSGRKKASRRAVPVEISMKDARAKLTEIVDLADWRGESTVLTRNGKPVAKVVPIPGRKPRATEGSDARK